MSGLDSPLGSQTDVHNKSVMTLTRFDEIEYPVAQISQEPTYPLTGFGTFTGPLDPVTMAFISGGFLGVCLTKWVING
jgi:hypothetical protein